MNCFKDKTAVITGGAHGIGKAIAGAFRSEGTAVHILDITPGDRFAGDIGDKETRYTLGYMYFYGYVEKTAVKP